MYAIAGYQIRPSPAKLDSMIRVIFNSKENFPDYSDARKGQMPFNGRAARQTEKYEGKVTRLEEKKKDLMKIFGQDDEIWGAHQLEEDRS